MSRIRGLIVKIQSSFYTKKRGWRVKHYVIRYYPHHAIRLSIRRFRTNPKRRSAGQFIVQCSCFGIREIAIKHTRNKKRSKKTKINNPFVRTNKKFVTNTLIAIGIFGVLTFGTQILHPKSQNLTVKNSGFTTPSPAPQTSLDIKKPITLRRSEPVHISIPRISVEAATELVGRNIDGSLETPNVLKYTTGWYRYSPTPGELGPAIIVGHVDSYKGPSVFWRLRELRPGDSISISRRDGSTAVFEITSMSQFDQNNFPTDKIYGNINYAGLRLITCGGNFDKTTGHYTSNTVVFAKLIAS